MNNSHFSAHSGKKRPSWRTRFTGRKQALPALAASFAIALSGCSVPAPAEDPATAGGTVEAETVATSSAPETSPPPAPKTATTTPSPGASLTPTPMQSAEGTASAGTALALLETIEIKGRAPKTGYDRDQFGSGWTDIDHNGCDTRNDILERDLTGETFWAGTNDCIVLTGTLAGPFTAMIIEFVRGDGTSNDVQIDHVVALSDAWQKGAQQLAENQREAFANDPLNLLAVDGPTNASKGDSDAATWLPPNKSFRCEYVALQTGVKAKYDLWMTQAEHDAIAGILTTKCPNQPVPDDDGGVAVPVAATPAPETEEPAPETDGAPAAPGDVVYYENCTAAREAGAAPVHRGDPGYATHLDGDGDGVGCE